MTSGIIPKSTRTRLYRSRARQEKRATGGGSNRFVTAIVNTRDTFFGKTSRKAYRSTVDRRKKNG